MRPTQEQRIRELKFLKRLAAEYLEHYKNLRIEHSKNWIEKKSTTSIEQLKEIINRINRDLHPNQVKKFCSPPPSFSHLPIGAFLSETTAKGTDAYFKYSNEILAQINVLFVLFELSRLAPQLNLLYDISWLSDGNISDYIEIQLGMKDISTLEAFLPQKIDEVYQKLIPYLSQDPGLNDICDIIKQAVRNTEETNFLISNILLITATESFVRKLALQLHREQNSQLTERESYDFIYNKFSSLESLILKGHWPYDYLISYSEAMTKYQDVNEEKLNLIRDKFKKHKAARLKLQQILEEINMIFTSIKSERELKMALTIKIDEMNNLSHDLMTDEEKTVKINLAIMLNFLVRKYKDDRNQIIHGNFENFSHKWKNYINYAALIRTFDVFISYQSIFKKHTD